MFTKIAFWLPCCVLNSSNFNNFLKKDASSTSLKILDEASHLNAVIFSAIQIFGWAISLKLWITLPLPA